MEEGHGQRKLVMVVQEMLGFFVLFLYLASISSASFDVGLFILVALGLSQILLRQGAAAGKAFGLNLIKDALDTLSLVQAH